MKHFLFSVGILALAGTFSAEAQTFQVQAKIPFEFHAGQKRMPAGTYTLQHSAGVLRIVKSGPSHSAAFLLVRGAIRKGREKDGRIVFNRYGEEYFLSKLWQPNYDDGLELPPARAEREMARRQSRPIETAMVKLEVQ